MIDPAIESHYGTGYERSRLFPGGRASLEYVRSMELLDRLLPAPPARLLDVGGVPGTYAAPLARPLYHLTKAAHRRQALAQAWRVLAPGGRLLATAICRFASLLGGLGEGRLGDPDFRPMVDQDLVNGQHRNPDPVGRPEFFTTAYFHTPDGLAAEIAQAGFTGTTVYGVEGPGWPLRQEWADPQWREHILFAARSVETQPSLTGFSHHLIAAATKPEEGPGSSDRKPS